jgi:methylmalonyl-CoA mutase, C-terminal domain
MSRELIALALMGIDQHENGAIAVARVLREAQMKVDYLGKFNTPASVAEKAIMQDADVVGVSCHSWEYLRLVPELVEELCAVS